LPARPPPTAMTIRITATVDALATHARDLLSAAPDLKALAGTQLIHRRVDAALSQREVALREAGAEP
jgi:hypothetical protein